ncbi:hypothetical protein QJS10_CPB17g01674 [Acorus calamus]|uniref:Peptidase S54 rhomboid domain-containing protein n=1 Tax=Acorus calamus TaxID=4465 RepID=A0AAV9CU48_ACOCL|nr:hypothetical protein QJS10_CPB17g01674 [Acorus calamus]
MFDYRNAPVTRTFMLGSGLLTILLGIKGRSSNLGFAYQDIFQNFRLWRLIASSFAFSSTPELVFGLGLLYYFRVFERQIGSNKYSVFILFSLLGSLLIEVLSLVVFRGSNLGVLASGPYGLVFASFVPFYFDIPVTSRFRIFGGRFSNKSLVYLAGLQLLLSAWERSFIPGICGILAGSMYHMNLLGIRRMKFPDFIATFFSRLPWPSTGGSSSWFIKWKFCRTCTILHRSPVGGKLSFDNTTFFRWQSHLRLPLLRWYRWASTGTQPDRHLYTLETILM